MFPFGRTAVVRILISSRLGSIKPHSFTTNSGVSNISVSDNDKNLYNNNGVICLRRIFSQEWIKKIQRGIQKARDNPSKMARLIPSEDDNQFVYFLDYNNCNRIAEFRDFIFNSPAAELTGKMMGSKKSIFYYDNIFAKDPNTSRPTPWHQDQTYYPLEGFQTCSIWMPTTPVSKDSCIKFIKGSHRWGHWYWPKQFSDSKDYKNIDTTQNKMYQRIPSDMDTNTEGKYEMLSWDVQPGDCLIFHMMCVHGFPSSVDYEGRAVLSTRWVGENVTFGTRPWEVEATLMKGNSKPGDYIYQNGKDYPTIWHSS